MEHSVFVYSTKMPGTRFSGKVVLISGSSKGIGQATAVKFAAEGAKIVLNGRSADDVEKTRKLCMEVGAKPWDLLPTVGDITNEDFVKMMVNTVIHNFGKLDILVSYLLEFV